MCMRGGSQKELKWISISINTNISSINSIRKLLSICRGVKVIGKMGGWRDKGIDKGIEIEIGKKIGIDKGREK